jgi:hypothetical protein
MKEGKSNTIKWGVCDLCGCVMYDKPHDCLSWVSVSPKITHLIKVLTPVGKLKLTFTIDPAVMRRAAVAIEEAGMALAGCATALHPYNRPDERNVIDQEE